MQLTWRLAVPADSFLYYWQIQFKTNTWARVQQKYINQKRNDSIYVGEHSMLSECYL